MNSWWLFSILFFILFSLLHLKYVLFFKEVDSELKLVCEQFISDVTDSYISPLISLLDKIDTILKMAEADCKDGTQLLKQQPFAKAGKLGL